MSKNKSVFSNILEYYSKSKNKRIKKLEEKNLFLNNKIVEEENLFNENLGKLNKLKFENSILVDEYRSVIRIAKQHGILFEFNNKGYGTKEWDNLYLEKNNKNYEIKTRDKQSILILDEKYTALFDDILKKYSYSMVVTRVDNFTIRAQFRIDKNII